MRIAIYGRVSTKDQSTEVQLDELRRYAEFKGWQIVGEFKDEAVSGRHASRPEFDKMMKLARARKLDAICCTKLDRFGRSVLNVKLAIMELDELNVRFLAIQQGIDTDKNNPVSRLLVNLLSAMAEFELELITSRRTEGIKKAQERGTKSGLPFGRPKKIFRRDLALEMLKEGKGYREIARELGESRATVTRAIKALGGSKPTALVVSLSDLEQVA